MSQMDREALAKIAELRAERDAYAERIDDLESHLCDALDEVESLKAELKRMMADRTYDLGICT